MAADSSILKSFETLKHRDPRLVHMGQWGSFGLANSGEEIVLRDGAGTLIDSVAYQSGWHRTGIGDPSGRSLERIRPTLSSNDPRNWSTCVDPRGGTPVERNSIYAGAITHATSLSCAPNPFSPDGDGWEDFAVVHYAIAADVAVINLKIFDMKGRLVRRLANNEASGAEGERIWDGCDDERRAAPTGIYILLLEACDQRGKLQWSSRAAVVVARRL